MRVTLKTKNKGIKVATYPCRKCNEPIKAGDKYYEWQHRHAAPSRQHQAHGAPRQSELCTGKMSGVYAAVESIEDAIAAAQSSDDISGLADVVRSAAESVEEVRGEYEEGLENMPDQLRDVGTGAETQEKIEALESFRETLETAADEIETAAGEIEDGQEEPDVPAEHDSDCPQHPDYEKVDEDDDEDCNCGLADSETEHDIWEVDYANWETAHDEKVSEACQIAETAVGELSV